MLGFNYSFLVATEEVLVLNEVPVVIKEVPILGGLWGPVGGSSGH